MKRDRRRYREQTGKVRGKDRQTVIHRYDREAEGKKIVAGTEMQRRRELGGETGGQRKREGREAEKYRDQG